MSWLTVTLGMYRAVLRRAALLTSKNWYVASVVFVYAAAMHLASAVAGWLGLLGGVVVSLASAACLGSFLSLIEMVVRTGRVSSEDFVRSAGAYVWDVVGVTFLLWLVFVLVTPVLAPMPQGRGIMLGLQIVLYVLLNAVPELIYLGRCSPVDLVTQSAAFIGENWIEWFPLTLALAVLVYTVGALPLTGGLVWIQVGVVALLVCFAMVVRGLLFLELHSSSRRGRAFRHRMSV